MGAILLSIRRTRRRANLIFRALLIILALGLTVYSTARLVRAHSARQVPTLFPPWPMGNQVAKLNHHKGDKLEPAVESEYLLPRPRESAFRSINEQTLDIDNGRYVFVKNLGCGYEGEGKVYIDTATPDKRKVVIKTFFAGTRVNPLPPHLLELFNPWINSWWWVGGLGPWVFAPAFKFLGMDAGDQLRTWGTIKTWPVEIPSTLWFSKADGTVAEGNNQAGLVQALDYFYLENRWFGKNWQLVFPYYEDGTLDDLARIVSRLGLKPHEVDRVYRADFLKFLDMLGNLHSDGYCHGDVKTDNIFLSPSPRTDNPSALSNLTMTWVAADLGNLREIPHIWHYVRPDPARPPLTLESRMDCRVVDTTRALKSYISFLRQSTAASIREENFDQMFYQGERGWSWVYWKFMVEAGEFAGYEWSPVEMLKYIFAKEEEKKLQVFAEQEVDAEDEKINLNFFAIKLREEVAVLREEYKSWKAGKLNQKPAWIADESHMMEEGWKKDSKILTEPVYGGSPGNSGNEQHNQKPLKKDISSRELRKTIDWELDCMANVKDYGIPPRILGKAME